MTKFTNRCSWLNNSNPQYVQYHDFDWGVPTTDDNEHFENLTLEGAQAGLSWEIVLKKREHYRKVFHDFDLKKVVKITPKTLEKILTNPGIIRNKLKVYSVVNNAKKIIEVQSEYGQFNHYIWGYTNNKIIYPNSIKNYRETNIYKQNLSKLISMDLKKRGFKFIGPTIIYSYLQASGIFQDHSKECFLFKKKLTAVNL